MGSDITRREALRRATWILGGTLSAPTILGVLEGCGQERKTGWMPRTLTPDQHDTVLAIAEVIIPETDTPGARSAGVDQFIDAMLTDYYSMAERGRFLSGLGRLDAQARRAHGKGFSDLSTDRQTAMVLAMDRAAFTEPAGLVGQPFRPELAERLEQLGLLLPAEARKSDVAAGEGVGADSKEAAMPPSGPEDTGPQSFFRQMKELAVVGYYTSEVGQRQELRLTPWGRYRDIPYQAGTPAWA